MCRRKEATALDARVQARGCDADGAAASIGLWRELGVRARLLYHWRGDSSPVVLTHCGRRPAFASQRRLRSKRRRLPSISPMPARSATPDRGTGAEDRPAAAGTGFFSHSLAACQGTTPEERRAWRDGIYAVIQRGDAAARRSLGSSGCARWLASAGPGTTGIGWRRSRARKRRRCAMRSSVCRWCSEERLPNGYRLITSCCSAWAGR